MTKHGTVPQNQYNEFLNAILTALPPMTPDQMQKFIRLTARTRKEKLRELFSTATGIAEAWREEWTRFYHEVFNLAVDLTEVVLPAEQEGFAWLVVLAKELGNKPMKTAEVAALKLFTGKTGQYVGDLDNNVTVNDRDLTNGSYAIRIRARVEADEENKNLSAIQIMGRKLVTMTLLERIILGTFYFWKTGKHLDILNWTLCSGSRFSRGGVPYFLLGDTGNFGVNSYPPDHSGDNLRARSVVV